MENLLDSVLATSLSPFQHDFLVLLLANKLPLYAERIAEAERTALRKAYSELIKLPTKIVDTLIEEAICDEDNSALGTHYLQLGRELNLSRVPDSRTEVASVIDDSTWLFRLAKIWARASGGIPVAFSLELSDGHSLSFAFCWCQSEGTELPRSNNELCDNEPRHTAAAIAVYRAIFVDFITSSSFDFAGAKLNLYPSLPTWLLQRPGLTLFDFNGTQLRVHHEEGWAEHLLRRQIEIAKIFRQKVKSVITIFVDSEFIEGISPAVSGCLAIPQKVTGILIDEEGRGINRYAVLCEFTSGGVMVSLKQRANDHLAESGPRLNLKVSLGSVSLGIDELERFLSGASLRMPVDLNSGIPVSLSLGEVELGEAKLVFDTKKGELACFFGQVQTEKN